MRDREEAVVGRMRRRLFAIEDRVEEAVEARVEERMKQEIDAVLDLLERRLSCGEFAKVARVIVEESQGEGGQ